MQYNLEYVVLTSRLSFAAAFRNKPGRHVMVLSVSCLAPSQSFHLRVLTPLVLLADLRFLLRRKVVGNVESGSNLFGRLALDHTGDRGTGQVEERLDIHVVGREDELKEENLLKVDKVGIPLLDDVRHGLGLERLLNLGHGFLQMVLAKLNDLLQDLRLDVRERNLELGRLVVLIVCNKVATQEMS